MYFNGKDYKLLSLVELYKNKKSYIIFLRSNNDVPTHVSMKLNGEEKQINKYHKVRYCDLYEDKLRIILDDNDKEYLSSVYDNESNNNMLKSCKCNKQFYDMYTYVNSCNDCSFDNKEEIKEIEEQNIEEQLWICIVTVPINT